MWRFDFSLVRYVSRVRSHHRDRAGSFFAGVRSALDDVEQALCSVSTMGQLRTEVEAVATKTWFGRQHRGLTWLGGYALVGSDLQLALTGWHVDPDDGVRSMWHVLAFEASADTVTPEPNRTRQHTQP